MALSRCRTFIRTVLRVAGDLLPLVSAVVRSHTQLAAENLFSESSRSSATPRSDSVPLVGCNHFRHRITRQVRDEHAHKVIGHSISSSNGEFREASGGDKLVGQ